MDIHAAASLIIFDQNKLILYYRRTFQKEPAPQVVLALSLAFPLHRFGCHLHHGLLLAHDRVGRLRLDQQSNMTIPYSFSYNGTAKPLPTISTFTLRDTFNAPGTYADNLIFELIAQ